MTLPALEEAVECGTGRSPQTAAPPSLSAVSSSAAHVPPEPQSPLQTSGRLRTDQANDLVCPPVRSGVAALDSSKLRSIVTGARQAHGPRRLRWSHKERLAWHELVVVRGISA